jgi:hypothetical protein
MANLVDGNDSAYKSIELDRGGKNIPGAFIIKSSHYIIGGFALAAAITWNTSIREAIKQKFPLPEDNVKANMIFAVVTTLILVLLIYVLPNTKSELPDSTRTKISAEEERHALRKKIIEEERRIISLEAQVRAMKSNYNGTLQQWM